MKALIVNALSRGFDFENVQIGAPIGREVLVNVQVSALCQPICCLLLTILSLCLRRLVTRLWGS
jgi:hypothetical protein